MADHEKTEAETYRRLAISLENQIDILKKCVAEEQKAKYNAYKRINELNKQLNSTKQ